MTSDDAVMNAVDAMGSVLEPIETDVFFSQYWEKTTLHLQRQCPAYFQSLLSIEQLQQLLESTRLYHPMVKLARSGSPVSADNYTGEHGQILPARLIDEYEKGATIVFDNAHQRFSSVSAFCRQLQGALQLRCQANAYLSPPSNQGFAQHYDTHDVFVLQVSGSKRFRVYSGGLDLPLTSDRFDPDCLGDNQLTEDIRLEAGDTLYIPRGVVHDAESDSAAPSLHITLGVFAPVLVDLLVDTLYSAASSNRRLRESSRELLPGGSDGVKEQNLDSLLEQVMAGLREPEFAAARSRYRDGIALENVPDISGRLTAAFKNDGLHIHSHLRVRQPQVSDIDEQDGKVMLRTPGQIFEFDGAMAVAVVYLIEQGQCIVGDLPGLPAKSQLALARRLLKDNIVWPGQ